MINLNFRRLLTGLFVSNLGTQIYLVGMVVWLTDWSESALTLGLLFSCIRISGILVSPLAGVVGDRFSRKKILVWTDLISGTLMLILFFILKEREIFSQEVLTFVIFSISVLISICGDFFAPACSAMTAELVPHEKMRQAFGLRSNGAEIAKISGQGLGGALVAWIGFPLVVLLNGLSFVLSAFSESKIKVAEKKKTEEMFSKVYLSYWKDLKEGFQFVWNDAQLRTFFIAIAIGNFLLAPLLMLLPILIHDGMGYSTSMYGAAMMAYAVGSFIGATIARKTNSDSKMIRLLALLIPGMAFASLSQVTQMFVMIPILMLSGASFVFIGVQIMSQLAIRTPNQYRARVFSLLGETTVILTPISLPLFGWLADQVGVQFIFGVSGILLFCSWALFWVLSESVRRFLFESDQIAARV